MKKYSNLKKIFLPIFILPSLFLLVPFQKDLSKDNLNNNLSTTFYSDPHIFPEPTSLSTDYIEQIAAGQDHSGAVINTNDSDYLYTWGNNDEGQLGLGRIDGPEIKNPIPTRVEFPSINSDNIEIEQIAMDWNTSAAIINDDGTNKLYMWGNNYSAQLGNGTKGPGEAGVKDNPIPDRPAFDSSVLKESNIEEVALGASHTAAILQDSSGEESLYMWGEFTQGQLASVTSGVISTSGRAYQTTPTKIDNLEIPNGGEIGQVSLGYHHSAAIIEDAEGKGTLYTWGDNSKGQLGREDKLDDGLNSSPEKVEFTDKDGEPLSNEYDVEQISMGAFWSAAIVNNGEEDILYTWGDNSNDQLGLGDEAANQYETPQIVTFDQKYDSIEQISMGTGTGSADDETSGQLEGHSSAVLKKGSNETLYTWGSNSEGQLANPGSGVKPVSKPEPVIFSDQDISKNSDYKQIALGGEHSIALVSDESNDFIYTAGRNQEGQLGSVGGSTNQFKEMLENHYLSNASVDVFPDKDSNFETINLDYEFETNVDIEKLEINIIDSKTNKPVDTKTFTDLKPERNSNVYSKNEISFSNLEKNKTYIYEITITYNDYDTQVLNKSTVAKGSFVNHLRYWYESTWFIMLIVLIVLTIFALIGFLIFRNWKIKRKVS